MERFVDSLRSDEWIRDARVIRTAIGCDDRWQRDLREACLIALDPFLEIGL